MSPAMSVEVARVIELELELELELDLELSLRQEMKQELIRDGTEIKTRTRTRTRTTRQYRKPEIKLTRSLTVKLRNTWFFPFSSKLTE